MIFCSRLKSQVPEENVLLLLARRNLEGNKLHSSPAITIRVRAPEAEFSWNENLIPCDNALLSFLCDSNKCMLSSPPTYAGKTHVTGQGDL